VSSVTTTQRSCAHCGTAFPPKTHHQRYCQRACERRANAMAESARRAAGAKRVRTCVDCTAVITGHPGLRRCEPHRRAEAERRRGKPRTSTTIDTRARLNAKIAGAVAVEERPRTKKGSANLRRNDPQLPFTSKPDMSGPDFEGDWFPGWDGCWSPSIEPEWREKIRRIYGPDPAPPSKKQGD
jgi:hypothetical protein